MLRKPRIIERINLTKLVHGGQALGEGPDGRKIFVWGGLPGEVVDVAVTKDKKSYLEGIVTEIQQASKDRVEPVEPGSYLSTSPWQIMTFEAENRHKQEILEETFVREEVSGVIWKPFVATGKEQPAVAINSTLPPGEKDLGFSHSGYGYRNKMEIGFWGDETGLHLAHYVRGTHGKQIVDGNKLVVEQINSAARAVRDELSRLEVWAGDLKILILRANAEKDVVGALFIKRRLDLSKFELPKELSGLDIYYSDPKSPAAKPTEKLYSLGDIKLMDKVGTVNIKYDVLSFFQVNIPIFNVALQQIKKLALVNNPARAQKIHGDLRIVDMYSGVGTIGLAVGADVLVELDASCVEMARINAKGTNVKIVHAASETALENITNSTVLIVDPPRAGLHRDVVERIISEKPPVVVYLSCNPVTQARDVKFLEDVYEITSAQGYNFFPRTPHIESLVILQLAAQKSV